MGLTATDLFCGAGGSSQGLHDAGIDVVTAANHWQLAVDTHNTNFPNTDHRVADISQLDPRLIKRTDILWASPSCTAHSQAAARQLKAQNDQHPDEKVSLDAAERSRATMFDVPRMADHHHYKAVIVENVVEVTRWVLWESWLHAMRALDYHIQVVSLNSMFAGPQPAPQSRDRVYVVCTRNGDRVPDVDIRPMARCHTCRATAPARLRWKRPDHPIAGRYRQQYTYTCPFCWQDVEPFIVPASTAIDWTIPGQRLGDRAEPLADGTMRRIMGGIDRYRDDPAVIIPLDRNKDAHKQAKSVRAPFATQTARASMALAFSPFIAELRGGSSDSRPVTDPLCTVTASGNHHMLVTPGFVMRNNGSKGDGREHCTPFYEPVRTMTTKGHQSLITDTTGTIDDVRFRMLQPHEVGAAMAFAPDYTVLGNKRERVRQYGNAVTPPASKLLIERVVTALTGETVGSVAA